MIELFEQDEWRNDWQSSKGNQLKWENNNVWYKADSLGYEGLSEYVISHLLKFSNLTKNEYVSYYPVKIKYRTKEYNGVSSKNFLPKGWSIITLERLFKTYYGKSLHQAIWTIRDHKERLKYLVENVKKITGLKDFGRYMNIILTIDTFFLNEDRHTHNLAVLMNENGDFDYCPIFDNGAGLLSDTEMFFPMEDDIYKLIDSVKGKTFCDNLEEQLEISEDLFGMNLILKFTKKDVENILSNDAVSIYSFEERERVRKVLFEQMRRYPYLFE